MIPVGDPDSCLVMEGISGMSWSLSVSQEAMGANRARGFGGCRKDVSSDLLSSLSTDSPRSTIKQNETKYNVSLCFVKRKVKCLETV